MKLALPELGGSKRKRADGSISFDDWLGFFNFDGLTYPLGLNQTLAGTPQQEIQPDYLGLADGALKTNGIVFACVNARARLFSEARFQYRPLGSYAGGDLFGNTTLTPLEKPWPGGSTRQMLRLMSIYEQLAGNAYVVERFVAGEKRLIMPRPDWMRIVLGTRRKDGKVGDLDTEIIGYAYYPNGAGDPDILLPENVSHFKTTEDPILPFRGMSWLQPVVTEIQADKGATIHKKKFFENGATANTVVTLDPNLDPDEFNQWVDLFEDGHRGAINAYKRIYLAGGADAKVIGADMQQMDFVNSQGHGEARICNAAGIPPIIVGVVKGLDSATYSNYGQAKRVWADGSMRPMWGAACEVLAARVAVPGGNELWYDDRHIAFLQDDRKDLAEVQQANASTLRSLIDAGFEPESAIVALESGDWSKLHHTGLFSVQLQPPGTAMGGNADTPPPNGNGNGRKPPAALLNGH